MEICMFIESKQIQKMKASDNCYSFTTLTYISNCYMRIYWPVISTGISKCRYVCISCAVMIHHFSLIIQL